MTKDIDSHLEQVETGSVLLGILPMFLRRELVDNRSFRCAIGFDAEELVTYGPQIKFSRSLFFETVSEAFKNPGVQSEISDQDQRTVLFLRP